jgi:hypothetical protein
MSEKLDYFKFKNSCNPFGILFHPLWQSNCLRCFKKSLYGDDIFFYNERWHCYDAHSDLSNPDPIGCKDLNTIIQST